LQGKTLLQWSIDAALDSGEFSKVLVSTDDLEIAETAKSLGADVSYPRPHYLSSDSSLAFEVIKYEMQEIRKRDSTFTHYVLLQATCPLRSASDISNAVREFKTSNFRSLISVMNAEQFHPSTLYQVEDKNTLRRINYKENYHSTRGTLRQEFESIKWRNGSIYIGSLIDIESTNLLLNEPLGFYEMPWYRSVNIDSLENVRQAEVILESSIFNDE
jgi:CMP-N-acetylneuraminic acid synthetase